MKWTDPTIELAACGSSGRNMPTFGSWEQTVLEHAFDHVEYISLHTYLNNYAGDTAAFLASSDLMDSFIDEVVAIADAVAAHRRSTKRLMLSFDEWNVWYRTRSHQDRMGGVEERYTLTDALAIATYLNGFMRNCRVVRMANFAQLVNAIAPIFTSPQGLFLQTIYHPLRLYAEHTLAQALDVHVEGECYALSPAQETDAGGGRVHHVADLGPFPLIDAASSVDEAGRELSIALVNRDRDRDLAAVIDVTGGAVAAEVSVWEVNGPEVGATNSFEHPRRVDVREDRAAARSGGLDYVCPAHSITILRLAIGPGGG
jgi:alpha-N-arabinofuranosidase